VASVTLCVCGQSVCVRAVKEKQLKLSTPNGTYIPCDPNLDVKKVKDQGHTVTKTVTDVR